MSYGYTYYTFGWLSKIIVSICKTFTVLKPIVNAASDSGRSTLTYIDEIVKEKGQYAIKKIQEASSEAITLIITAGPVIMEGMSKFFANYILTYVMSFWDYLKNGLKDKLQGTILTSTLESIFKIWEAKSKELVTLQDKNKLEIYNKQTYNLVPINKQIISLIVPELIDELNKPLPLENGITVTDEDNIGEISVIQSTIKYPFFENAVMKNDKGDIYIDASILQKNFQEMTEINFTKVMGKIQEKVMKEGENNFGKFYEENIKKAGLPLLLSTMTKYIDSKDELNQPLLMLLFMGTEELINVFITNNVKLTQKILLFMALIALFFLNLTVR
jgi:hypothetical protein